MPNKLVVQVAQMLLIAMLSYTTSPNLPKLLKMSKATWLTQNVSGKNCFLHLAIQILKFHLSSLHMPAATFALKTVLVDLKCVNNRTLK